jgi:hypothetical protein
MPLGLMPDMVYEEKDVTIHPGESVIMYSDGLLEAHNPQGEMFGSMRIREMIQTPACGEALIKCMLSELTSFTRPGWEQEDDDSLVGRRPPHIEGMEQSTEKLRVYHPSEPGNEKIAMEQVAEASRAVVTLAGRPIRP